MTIQEATKESLETGKMMHRKEGLWERIRILPTNGGNLCEVHRLNDGEVRFVSQRWNPSADDLSANDWELTD